MARTRTRPRGVETRRPLPGGWSDSTWFDLIAALLAVLTVAGVYLDGWAHNHDRVDDSFVTPWHAVLYASVLLTALFFGVSALSKHSRGATWTDALPRAYRLSAIGVVLFLTAGFADLGWHALFGIELDTAALLSPTHLMLALAGVLTISGPWRSALAAHPAGVRLTWQQAGVLMLSVAAVMSVLAFMTQFAHPLVDTLASRERPAAQALADVQLMNADGTMQTRLTLAPDTSHGFGVWSPDGSRLISSAGKPDEPSDLFLLDARSGSASQLTHTPFLDYTPSWSPDGSRIAFVSATEERRGRNTRADVFVISAAGGEATQITHSAAPEWGTTWSPDGSRIAFSSRRNGVWQVFSIAADGSDERQLTSESRSSIGPAWSPDGRTIAFHRLMGRGESLIFLMDADGGNVRSLPGTGDDYHPAWSPDGMSLAFTSLRDGTSDIYVMSLEGQEVRNLTQSSGLRYDYAAWSPDGRQISFTSVANPNRQDHELMRRLGIASVILQAALLVGPLLIVVWRWRLPPGAITLTTLLTGVCAAVLRDHYELLPAAVFAGMAGEVVLRASELRLPSIGRMRVFAVVVPATFYAAYFFILWFESEIDWTVHLWGGSILIAGMTGLGLSYLLAPPGPAPRTNGQTS